MTRVEPLDKIAGDLRMRFVDIDSEGISDGISMVKINSFLKSKKTIFINGTDEDNLMMQVALHINIITNITNGLIRLL